MYGNMYADTTLPSSVARSSTATSLTWSNPNNPVYVGSSGHLPIPYTSFEPGPSTSTAYGQSSVFQFPAYPTMPMPFDYSQVFSILAH